MSPGMQLSKSNYFVYVNAAKLPVAYLQLSFTRWTLSVTYLNYNMLVSFKKCCTVSKMSLFACRERLLLP